MHCGTIEPGFFFAKPKPAGDLVVFVLGHGWLKPSRPWQASQAHAFCNQPALLMGTLAEWIFMVFTTYSMIPMLGTSTLEWRNRCIAMHSFPLPREGSFVMEGYGMKHALATLLSVTSVEELISAFRALEEWPVHMFHVLNCILCAVTNHVSEITFMDRLAHGVVIHVMQNRVVRSVVRFTLM